jgi:hypothetical protein
MKNAPYKLQLKTAPTVEPVTGAELAKWLGATYDPDVGDPVIDALIPSAREECERFLGIALMTQTWEQFYDIVSQHEEWWDGVREGSVHDLACLPGALVLGRWPLVSVTSVKFYDVEDAPTTADVLSYFVDKHTRPPSIALRQGFLWPSISYRVRNAAVVEFVAGFSTDSDPDDVPEVLKSGIKALAAYQYEHRGECEAEEAIRKSGAFNYWKTYRTERT